MRSTPSDCAGGVDTDVHTVFDLDLDFNLGPDTDIDTDVDRPNRDGVERSTREAKEDLRSARPRPVYGSGARGKRRGSHA